MGQRRGPNRISPPLTQGSCLSEMLSAPAQVSTGAAKLSPRGSAVSAKRVRPSSNQPIKSDRDDAPPSAAVVEVVIGCRPFGLTSF